MQPKIWNSPRIHTAWQASNLEKFLNFLPVTNFLQFDIFKITLNSLSASRNLEPRTSNSSILKISSQSFLQPKSLNHFLISLSALRNLEPRTSNFQSQYCPVDTITNVHASKTSMFFWRSRVANCSFSAPGLKITRRG